MPSAASAAWRRAEFAHAYSLPRTPRRWRTSSSNRASACRSARTNVSAVKPYTPIVASLGTTGSSHATTSAGETPSASCHNRREPDRTRAEDRRDQRVIGENPIDERPPGERAARADTSLPGRKRPKKSGRLRNGCSVSAMPSAPTSMHTAERSAPIEPLSQSPSVSVRTRAGARCGARTNPRSRPRTDRRWRRCSRARRPQHPRTRGMHASGRPRARP